MVTMARKVCVSFLVAECDAPKMIEQAAGRLMAQGIAKDRHEYRDDS